MATLHGVMVSALWLLSCPGCLVHCKYAAVGYPIYLSGLFPFGDLQLHRMRHGANVRIVVLVDARLKGACVNGVLGAQAESYGYGLFWSKRVEVEDCLRGCEGELLQAAALLDGGFLLKGLQVLAEQIETGRYAKVDHDHVGGLGEVVADGGGGGGDVVLGETRAVIRDIDGERLRGRLLFPRSEVA